MVHFLTGAVVGLGGERVLGEWRTFVVAAVVWAVGLNGGTLALNSAFDRDEGDVGYLDAPPPVAWWLVPFSLLFLFGGQAIALLFGLPFAGAYFVCLIMSLFYSVPPFRWKRLAGVDLVINCFGYGFWTFVAGALVLPLPLEDLLANAIEDPRTALLQSPYLAERIGLPTLCVGAGFFFLFGALYPLTQLYQVEEDRARGDLTLVLWLGPRTSVLFALLCAVLAHGCFALAVMPGQVWRDVYTVLILSLLCWSSLLLLWYVGFHRFDHQRGMYRALGCWAVTNLSVLLVFGTHGR